MLHPRPVPDGPWHGIHVDFKSENCGDIHCYIITDCYTLKGDFVIPVPDNHAILASRINSLLATEK